MSTITFTCPHCQSQTNFPSTAVGQQGKCSGCQQIVTIQPDPTPATTKPAATKKIIIFAAVAASAFGVVILCISGSLLVYFSQQEGISIHIPQQEGISIPISTEAEQLLTPRERVKLIVGDLTGRFEKALYKSEMFRMVEEDLNGATPQFHEADNKAELYHRDKVDRSEHVSRVGIEFLDHTYSSTDNVAEFKLQIYRDLATYTNILGNTSVSGGRLTNRYTLYFSFDNGDCLLDKVTRSQRGIASDGFSEPKIFSHSKEPALQLLFEGHVDF